GPACWIQDVLLACCYVAHSIGSSFSHILSMHQSSNISIYSLLNGKIQNLGLISCTVGQNDKHKLLCCIKQ
ncbi:MAG: hypothetical protein M3Z49_06480, partial [Bifidobacteriales bacterium]|nr:hypothetical protein [Bifidobacteriales bacterium]